jgi:ketosteroid isomerase-like protein
MTRQALLAAAAALLLSACAAISPAVTTELELMNADRAFAQLAMERGAGPAFAAILDPRQGQVIRHGKAVNASAVPGLFAPAWPFYELRWTPEEVRAGRFGDIGVTSGTFTRTIGGAENAKGRYSIVWRRDGQGQWRALMHTSSDDATGAPAAAPRR